MSATVQSSRPTVLVIHDDGDALDLMTRLFEASGFDVLAAISSFRAQAYLESDRRVDVVVVPWDASSPIGGDVYRWALQQRYDLRDRFVFVASSEVPGDFDRVVAGRSLAVSTARPAEIVRVAHAVVRRQATLARDPDAEGMGRGADRPSLLLAEDEPVLLAVMTDLLAQAGFSVTPVDGGKAAISQLEKADFDAIVSDWYMDDGSGADLHRWLAEFRPWLATRMIFLSSEEAEDVAAAGAGRPIFRKGQDSAGLIALLEEIVREARAGA